MRDVLLGSGANARLLVLGLITHAALVGSLKTDFFVLHIRMNGRLEPERQTLKRQNVAFIEFSGPLRAILEGGRESAGAGPENHPVHLRAGRRGGECNLTALVRVDQNTSRVPMLLKLRMAGFFALPQVPDKLAL